MPAVTDKLLDLALDPDRTKSLLEQLDSLPAGADPTERHLIIVGWLRQLLRPLLRPEVRPLAELERDLILRAVDTYGTTKAAMLIGISARTIQYKLKRYREPGIQKEPPRGLP